MCNGILVKGMRVLAECVLKAARECKRITHCVLDTPFPPSVFKKFVSLRIRLLRISCARTSYNLLSSFAEITTRRTLQGIYEHIVLAEKRHNLVMFCESDCRMFSGRAISLLLLLLVNRINGENDSPNLFVGLPSGSVSSKEG
ncbi:hypothetical protein Avbf_08422 [Armadillidium vulgare]|nr:hypothetical protein Avbf_08422 [Armadillidium vulgare]